MVDLFGMARGYGLSFGLLIMSLFHLLSYLKKKDQINIYIYHLASLLAVLSSFTILTYYVASLALIVLINLQQHKSERIKFYDLFKKLKGHYLPFLFNIIVLYEPVRRVIQHSNLDFGGKSGFYTDTFSSFIRCSFYGIEYPYWIEIFIHIIVVVGVVFPFLFIILNHLKHKATIFNEHIELIATSFILIFISLLIIANHLILGADYPIGRFAAYLIPIFWVQFGFLAKFLSIKSKAFVLVLTSTIALASSAVFISKLDLKSYGEWSYDAQTKSMIQDMVSENKANNDTLKQVSIGCNWLFEPTINFYRVTYGLNWLLPADREGISCQDDFIFSFHEDIRTIDSSNYEIIQKYEVGEGAILLKKNNF